MMLPSGERYITDTGLLYAYFDSDTFWRYLMGGSCHLVGGSCRCSCARGAKYFFMPLPKTA